MFFFFFFVTVTVLIFVHELGHLIAARLVRVKVRTLSVGFGPPLLSHKDRTGTTWKLSYFPFGGYVQLEERNRTGLQIDSNTTNKFFNSCSFYEKSFVALAGPFANIIFAFILVFFVTYLTGSKILPILGSTEKTITTELNELKENDEVIDINGVTVGSFDEMDMIFRSQLALNPSLLITIKRGSSFVQMQVSFKEETRKVVLTNGIQTTGLSPGINGFVVEEVKENSLGEKFGFKKDDLIVSVNEKNLDTLESKNYITNKSSQKSFSILRPEIDEEESFKKVIFDVKESSDELIGLKISPNYINRAPFTLWESFRKSVFIISSHLGHIFATIGNFVTGAVTNISGPLDAGTVISKSFENGYGDYIVMMSILSLSIGVLNLIPLPALDGGNFLIYIIEFVRNKPFNEAFYSIVQRIGVALIFFVVLGIILNDLKNFF